MDHKVKILLALTDSNLARQISEKIKERFEKVPLQFDVSEDGHRALNDFRNKLHELVFISQDLAGLNGEDFAREAGRDSGYTMVFVLGAKEGAGASQVERVPLPIVNWTDFLDRVQAALPEEVKARFGLTQRNSILYEKLTEYGKKYLTKASDDGDLAPLICIPQILNENPIAQKDSVVQKVFEKTIFPVLSSEQYKVALHWEVSILTSLLVITAGVYIWSDGSDDSLFSFKTLLALLTVISFFGFFVSRAFDRFILSKNSET